MRLLADSCIGVNVIASVLRFGDVTPILGAIADMLKTNGKELILLKAAGSDVVIAT